MSESGAAIMVQSRGEMQVSESSAAIPFLPDPSPVHLQAQTSFPSSSQLHSQTNTTIPCRASGISSSILITLSPPLVQGTGGSPLHIAARKGHLDMVRLLLSASGAVVDLRKGGATGPGPEAGMQSARDAGGHLTPAHIGERMAADASAYSYPASSASEEEESQHESASEEMSQHELASGATPQHDSASAATPQHDSASRETPLHDSASGETPLHEACREGHVKVAKLLLDSGANADSTVEVCVCEEDMFLP